jgi:hypothetical protein
MKPYLSDTSLPDPAPADDTALHLHQEVAAAREVLDGLMRLWRGQTELTIDDARRLSVLVFSGARTVALLLAHQMRLGVPTDDQDWLTAALEAMGKEYQGE